MGELLIAMSALPSAADANYEVFESVLTRYVDAVDKIALPSTGVENDGAPQQLRLLEKKRNYG